MATGAEAWVASLPPEGLRTNGFAGGVLLVAALNVGLKTGGACEGVEPEDDVSLVAAGVGNKGFGGDDVGVVEKRLGLAGSGVAGLKEGASIFFGDSAPVVSPDSDVLELEKELANMLAVVEPPLGRFAGCGVEDSSSVSTAAFRLLPVAVALGLAVEIDGVAVLFGVELPAAEADSVLPNGLIFLEG
jgi:hypothetical protein